MILNNVSDTLDTLASTSTHAHCGKEKKKEQHCPDDKINQRRTTTITMYVLG